MTPQLKLCENGFQIVFANGVTASVQFGEMHYCRQLPGKQTAAESAEVAAFVEGDDHLRGWVTQEIFPDLGDDVAGYQSPEQVVYFLTKCAALPAR